MSASTLHDRAVRLLCFGGPLNEQMVDVEPGGTPIEVLLPDRRPMLVDDPPEVALELPRRGRYDIERVAYHDDRKCRPPLHDQGCRWDARCLVFEGYPKERITDSLNAIVGLTRLWLPL